MQKGTFDQGSKRTTLYFLKKLDSATILMLLKAGFTLIAFIENKAFE
jgi:hypothetical protein